MCVCVVCSYSWLSMRFISSVMFIGPGASSSEVLGSASISEFSSSDTARGSFLRQHAVAPCKPHALPGSTPEVQALLLTPKPPAPNKRPQSKPSLCIVLPPPTSNEKTVVKYTWGGEGAVSGQRQAAWLIIHHFEPTDRF